MIFHAHSSISIPTNCSISEWLTNNNPYNVSSNKVIMEDTLSRKNVTFGGIRNIASRLATGLKTAGLREGDVATIVAPNSIDFFLAAHGVLWAGAAVAPINPSLTPQEIAYTLSFSKPTFIFLYPPILGKVQEAILIATKTSGLLAPQIVTLIDKVTQHPNIDSFISKDQAAPFRCTNNKQALAFIGLSSGTTGTVKGVKLSHHNMIANCMQLAKHDPEQINADQIEVFFPPCMLLGSVNLIPRSSVIAMHAFEIEKYCQATWAHIVPPVALALATSPVVSKYDLSSLKILVCAAAPLKKDLQERLMARLPQAKVLQMYGMTEASPVTHLQRVSDYLIPGTVGSLVSNMEARIIDDSTGKDLGTNETGELLVRGPNIMMGYVGDRNNIGVLSSDGWYSSGDIAYVDRNGLFYIVDRKKELIKYKGFQVPPAELEDLLLAHPKVLDAAVCAYYSPEEATEVPLAYVVLSSENRNQETCKEIQLWIDRRVAGYKQLRGGVHILDEIPRNPSGKILRRMLPARLHRDNKTSKI